MTEIRFNVPPEVAEAVTQAVEAGEYASVDALVQEALHLWQQDRVFAECDVEYLRTKAQEATADTSPGVSAEQVLLELEQERQPAVRKAG